MSKHNFVALLKITAGTRIWSCGSMAAVSSSVTSLTVTWAESASVGSTWTQTCLEKFELAAETIRLMFFVIGNDASLGPLSYLYVLIRRARVQIISNGECTGDDITVQSLGHLGPVQPWGALREYKENAHLRSCIASTKDTIQELQLMVSDEDPVHTFFGPPLDLLNRISNASAPPVAPGP